MDAGFDVFNLLESDTLERELELCGKLGADVDALKSLNFDIYQLAEIRKGYEARIDVSRYLDPKLSWSQMEEIRLELTERIDMSAYRENGYDDHQIYEIRKGISRKLDVSQYDSKDYFAEQMREIRKGLLSGVPVVFYKDPKFTSDQMREIRKGLEQNLDISTYARADLPYLKMRVIRRAMKDGLSFTEDEINRYSAGVLEELHKAFLDKINLQPYIDRGYDEGQLKHIRAGLKEGLPVDDYMLVTMRGESLHEILLGLEAGLDVSVYATETYNWQQMRELRLGLEHRIDVTPYARPLYEAAQMKEIRLGLEQGLDVSLYSGMVHTAPEMREIRERLAAGETGRGVVDITDGARAGESMLPASEAEAATGELTGESSNYLTITDDKLYCYLMLPKPKKNYSLNAILALIKKANVVKGVDTETISSMIEYGRYDTRVEIARGEAPVVGEDGYYEYFFDTAVPSAPGFTADGSADYSKVKYFESVNAGDKLAVYHPAKKGRDGVAVTGEVLPGKSGVELPVLKGKGFMVLEDHHTYCAAVSGVVRMHGNNLLISRLLTTDEARLADGDINYAGSVLVKGDLRSGVTLKADGDVVIEGTMGGATLICGGDAIFMEGIVGRQRAKVEVAGNIYAKFIEDASVTAGDSIYTNASLNCNVKAGDKLMVYGDKGTVYGGSIQTVMGLETAYLGNHNNIRTNISMGISAALLVEYNKTIKAITRVKDELSRFKQEQEKLVKVPGTSKEIMQLKIKINAAVSMKTKELQGLTDKRRELETEIKRVSGTNARVRNTLYAGVAINIDGTNHIYASDITGPNGVTLVKRGMSIVADRG